MVVLVVVHVPSLILRTPPTSNHWSGDMYGVIPTRSYCLSPVMDNKRIQCNYVCMVAYDFPTTSTSVCIWK